MAHTTKVLASALVLATALSACGGGGSKKANPTADLAAAKAAVLTKADLPGYDSTPHEASDDAPESVKTAFRECTKAEVTPLDDAPNQQKADSDSFDKNDASIDNTVIIAATKSDIDKRWKAVVVGNAPSCIEDLFRAAVQSEQQSDPSSKLDAIHADKLRVEKVGDRSVAFRVKASATSSEGSGDAYFDVLFAQKGRGVAELFVTQPQSPFDVATETALLKKVIDRLPKS
jgi:hypothetical protein